MAARRRDLFYLAGALGLLVWATWPADTLSITQSCEPKGSLNSISARLHPTRFWNGQLAAVIERRDELLTQPARRARAAAELEREMRENPGLEEKMMRLSREQGRVDDKAERERQDAAQQSARMKTVMWLLECEGVIGQRLAQK